jgi:uncharacterized protein YecE (DUF72 family)
VIGCPLWAEPAWQGSVYTVGSDADQRLAQYSRIFGAVEGNTTFYSLPSAARVSRWAEMLSDDFHFCAKLPQAVSHCGALDARHRQLQMFFERMAPLEQRLGPVWLQLPAGFGADGLDSLARFLDGLPSAYRYAVEVRHPVFFAKGEVERQLNRLLHGRAVERIVFDARALFASQSKDVATLEAQQRKPRLPVHAVALTTRPAVRFVGGLDARANWIALRPWLDKCVEWLQAGLNPMLFMHTPDNRQAPALARDVQRALCERLPGLAPMPEWPGERQAAEQPQQAGLF